MGGEKDKREAVVGRGMGGRDPKREDTHISNAQNNVRYQCSGGGGAMKIEKDKDREESVKESD